jgi:N-acetylmuramoyl-L-alanine amidase
MSLRRWPAAKRLHVTMTLLAGTLLLLASMPTIAVGQDDAPAATEPPSSAGREEQALPLIAIDAGHGGREPGSVHRGAGGRVDLIEKEVNLEIALRVEALLSGRGFGTVMTRWTDTEVNVPVRDLNGDGRVDPDDDLQARVDVANDARADLLFSIHNNGATDPRFRGTYTFYCSAHPLGEDARNLAALLQVGLLGNLRDTGYPDVVNGGFRDDGGLGKPFGHLFLVGPQTPRVARVSQMPGVVGESLFVSSDREALLLQDGAVLDAVARAYYEAALGFFGIDD